MNVWLSRLGGKNRFVVAQTEEASLKVWKFYREKIKELQYETIRLSAEYEEQIDEFEMKK